jgi:hypothetical protein
MGKDGESIAEIKEKIGQGQMVEIGGYQMNPELVKAIEKIKMENLCPLKSSHIIWKDISLYDAAVFGPASRNLIVSF